MRVTNEILRAAQVAASLCPEKVRTGWCSAEGLGYVAELGPDHAPYILISCTAPGEHGWIMKFYPHEWQ